MKTLEFEPGIPDIDLIHIFVEPGRISTEYFLLAAKVNTAKNLK